MLDQGRLLRSLSTCSIVGVTYIIVSNVTSWFGAMMFGVGLAALASFCKEAVSHLIDGEDWDKNNFIAEAIGIIFCIIVIIISAVIYHE